MYGKILTLAQKQGLRLIDILRVHPIVFILKRIRRLMASIVIWLIGLLFFGIGCWILLLRFEGLADWIEPHSMSIGQMTVDGTESKGYAELLRARFNHHFRRPVEIAKETGFLEVVTLDTPELFQPKALDVELKEMTIEVSGIDVTKLIHFVNQLFKPDQWAVEGDFQTHSDRVMLVLRFRRGERLIRTWYFERLGNPAQNKSMLLQHLIDDAIFQLVYDFGSTAEQDRDICKWRNVVKAPTNFPNRASLAAYYEARGALGRYYAYGDWGDLDAAITCFRTLQGQMPKYEDGLELLGIALAEKRCDSEAIHVYEQLQLLWKGQDWARLPSRQKRRQLSIDLLKATSTTKLYTWQSTHQAVRDLLKLKERLQGEKTSSADVKDRAAYSELLAHTSVQLAFTYALYLSYMRNYAAAEIFGSSLAPDGLQVSPSELEALIIGPDDKSRPIVLRVIKKVKNRHGKAIKDAEEEEKGLEAQWGELADTERRKAELISRLHLASGYANYRMAEFENSEAREEDTIFAKTYHARLDEAEKELRVADATHPNHYLVLQLLGLVFSEPRRKDNLSELSIAEQYFERSIHANKSDYYGHELLAGILFRRVANKGVDLADRAMMEKGLAEAQEAIVQREISGSSYLLRAEFETMLLKIERDATRRQELRAKLKQDMDQAERFLPHVFGHTDPDLMWVRIVADTLQLGEQVEAATSPQAKADDIKQKKLKRFMESKEELRNKVVGLIKYCKELEERWIAHQRVVHVQNVRKRAEHLRDEIEKATPANWCEIQIPFR